MNKPWTDENIEFLRANWLKMSSREIALVVGFHSTSVRHRAKILGLENKLKFWTEEKLQILRDNWLSMNAHEIGELIGYEITAIKEKARYLGLPSKKNSWWTEERIAFLREKWPTDMRADQIASEPAGCSKNSIIGKAHRLKLADKRPIDWGYREQEHQRRKIERAAQKITEKALRQSQQEPTARDQPTARNLTKIFDLSLAGLITLDITFTDLKSGHCRWPVGDAGAIVYCGHQKLDGQSYCAAHYCMSYLPTNTRTRSAIAAVAQRSKELESV